MIYNSNTSKKIDTPCKIKTAYILMLVVSVFLAETNICTSLDLFKDIKKRYIIRVELGF